MKRVALSALALSIGVTIGTAHAAPTTTIDGHTFDLAQFTGASVTYRSPGSVSFDGKQWDQAAGVDLYTLGELAAGQFGSDPGDQVSLNDRSTPDWLQLNYDGRDFSAMPFDPAFTSGPMPSNLLHLNNVSCNSKGMYISGMRTGGLLAFDGRKIIRRVTLPAGVHNAQPWREGVLFNDTESDRVRYVTPEKQLAFDVPRYDEDRLTHTGLDDSRIARQAFGRGLCLLDDDILAAGSSPSTITLHDLKRMKTTRMVTLSMDIRNTIHGLEVWPF